MKGQRVFCWIFYGISFPLIFIFLLLGLMSTSSVLGGGGNAGWIIALIALGWILGVPVALIRWGRRDALEAKQAGAANNA